MIDVLNRLSVFHNRSLIAYLRYAVPYLGDQNNDDAATTLQLIAKDHESIVDKVGELILTSGHAVNSGDFPLYFTGYNDLSVEYLLTLLTDRQHKLIAGIEQCIADLSVFESSSYAVAIAQEALGAAKGHLESLEELQSSPSA